MEAVVLSISDYERLVPDSERKALVEFLESLWLGERDLPRDDDRGRDPLQ